MVALEKATRDDIAHLPPFANGTPKTSEASARTKSQALYPHAAALSLAPISLLSWFLEAFHGVFT